MKQSSAKNEQQKIIQLQNIIEEGLGNRTKKAFALEVGITPEHLSRMLKKGYKTLPSKKVLVSLAKGLPNTSIQELFDIFEIESEEKSLSPIELCSVIMQDFKETYNRVINAARLFESAEGFLSELKAYSLYDMTQFERIEVKLAENDYETLEIWKLVYQSKEIELNYYVMFSFYKVASSNKVIVGQAYYKLDEMRAAGFKLYATIGDPYTCSFINIVSGEEYDTTRKIKSVKYGFGFYLDEVSDEKIKEFIDKYGSGEFEEKSFNKEIISDIMRTRTKLNFSFIKGESSCGILLDEEDMNEMLDSIVMNYAKELGVEKYGYIHFIIMEELKEDKLKYVIE